MWITISDHSNFAFDNITITQPKKGKGTYKNQFLIKSPDGNANYIFVLSPPMKCISNIIKGSDGNLYIELEFPRNSPDFYRFFVELDEEMRKTAIIHSNEWFHKPLRSNEIDECYKSSIINRQSKDLSIIYAPILRVNIQTVNDQIICLFDEFGKKFAIDLLTTGNDQILRDRNMIAILHIAGLKFTKRNFSTNIMMFQGKVLHDHLECMIKGDSPPQPSNTSPLNVVEEIITERTKISSKSDYVEANHLMNNTPESVIDKLVKNAESKLENSSKEQLLI